MEPPLLNDTLALSVLVHLRQSIRGRGADNPPDAVWSSLTSFVAHNVLLLPDAPLLVADASELTCPPGSLQSYKLVAHVGRVQRTTVERLPVQSGVSGSVEVTRATIIDVQGESLPTLPIVDAEIARRLRRLQAGAACALTVVPIALPERTSCADADGSLDAAPRRIYVHVLDVDESVTSLDRVAATDEEREWARQVVDDIIPEGTTVQEYIVTALVDNLRIRGIDKLTYMLDLLEFVVLQACSCDRIDGACGKLHGLIKSDPGAGKKLMMRAVAVLSPHTEQVSAAKVSMAGLVGNASTGQPGALVRASGGAACLSDAHELRGRAADQLAYVLQELMEDGTVTDSKSTRTPRREANTATMLDMNEPTDRFRSILAKRAYISRVDMAISIDVDADRTWDVARERVEHARAGDGRLDDRSWERPLRVLVAYLRDTFGESVDLSAARPAMVAFIDGLRDANAESHVALINDVVTRLPNTLTRLVAARAVACARSHAVAEDVEAVQKFVEMKLQLVKLAPPPKTASSNPTQPTPAEFIREQAAANGNRVDLTALAKTYEERYPRRYSRKTFERAGQALGAVRVGHGVYQLPAANQNGEDDLDSDVQMSG